MKFLHDGFADDVLEEGGFELLEKAVRWFAWKPQLPVKKAHEGFREAAKLDSDGVWVSVCVMFGERCMQICYYFDQWYPINPLVGASATKFIF